MVEVRVVTSLDSLDEHADAWDRLTMASYERLPMLSHAWVSSFLEHAIPADASWQCLFAYQGAELIGVLPLVRARGWGCDQLRGPSDPHTEIAHPLLAANAASSALVALVEAVSELAPRMRMRWYRVRHDSPLLASLPVLEPHRTVVQPVSTRGSLLRTTAQWRDFEAALSTNFRRNLRKAANRAAREHSVAFHFVGGAEAQSPAHLRQFLHVESSGWKGVAGTAIAGSPQLVAFYGTLTRRLAQRGWLEWHTMELDREPVACHLAVRLGDAVSLPKIGYDEMYARYGPGNLLFRELLERSFNDPAVGEVNCLSDMPWHSNWGMQQIGYADVMISQRGPLATPVSMAAMWKPAARAYAHRHPHLLRQVRRTRARLRASRRLP